MPRPPGAAPAPTRRNHVDGGKQTAISAALVSRYVTICKADPALAEFSANKVSRVVRRFIAAGLHERDLGGYVVGYADPTGETAVRNVLKAANR
jgi:hypothetical protein